MNIKDGTRNILMGVDAAGGIISVLSANDLILRTANLEKMRIVNATGNVGIGTTAPTQRLSVNGNADKVGGGSWATFSDIRLKNQLGSFDRGLDEISALSPMFFSYKEGNALGYDSDAAFVGFSAQEVKKVIPEAVTLNENGYLELNQDPILWTMLNAIKELKAENDALKARVEALEK